MTLGIIAGSGALPEMLLAAIPAAVLVRLKGVATNVADTGTVIDAEFERLGDLFVALHDVGVTELVFAGAMQRPKLNPTRLDGPTMKLVPRIMAALSKGDDGLLREVLTIFTEAGFEIKAAHDILPDLVLGDGVLVGELDAQTKADATRGMEILTALGGMDVGQGCVVAKGQCIGIETLQGTDRMLEFVAATQDRVPGGGVLVKRAKTGQDLRIDMPTVGPDTIAAAAAAGLTGICVQAGYVLVLNKKACMAAATAAGITIWASP